jgi:hypothetical protein
MKCGTDVIPPEATLIILFLNFMFQYKYNINMRSMWAHDVDAMLFPLLGSNISLENNQLLLVSYFCGMRHNALSVRDLYLTYSLFIIQWGTAAAKNLLFDWELDHWHTYTLYLNIFSHVKKINKYGNMSIIWGHTWLILCTRCNFCQQNVGTEIYVAH